MLDRKSAPSFAAINSFKLPTADSYVIKDNIPVYVLGGVTQQVVKIELVFNAAKWSEPKNGLSYFTALMLEKGTERMSSYEIANFFDHYGASIEIVPGFDNVSVSLFCLTKNIHKVLPIFLELVTIPSFPENEFLLLKDIFKQNLKVNHEKTSYVASKLIRQHLYGIQHPYGRSLEEQDVDEINAADLQEYFNNNFCLTHIFVTGYLNDKSVRFLLSGFENISSLKSNIAEVNENIIQTSPSSYVEKEGSIQTSLRIGKRTITRKHENYPTLVLLNHILGGYFGSRLMKNIREEKGLTYGIYSSIHNFQRDAYFVIGADVNKNNRVVALSEIKNEIYSLYDSLISQQELQTAKNHLLGSLQLEISNPFFVIEKIKTIYLNKLDIGFYENLFNQIQSINPSYLLSIAVRYLKNDLTEVSVG